MRVHDDICVWRTSTVHRTRNPKALTIPVSNHVWMSDQWLHWHVLFVQMFTVHSCVTWSYPLQLEPNLHLSPIIYVIAGTIDQN